MPYKGGKKPHKIPGRQVLFSLIEGEYVGSLKLRQVKYLVGEESLPHRLVCNHHALPIVRVILLGKPHRLGIK